MNGVLDEVFVERAVQNIFDEHSVDFNYIAGEIFQETERRITGSEIVHRDLNSHVVEFGKLFVDEFPIVNALTFGQLENDCRRIYPVAFDTIFDEREEHMLFKLIERNIYAPA